MQAHPAADLFPMLPDEELRLLAVDIKKNGLRLPVVTIEDGGARMVLDGRNRYRACAMAGIEPTFMAFAGDDPFAFVVSANLHRRHMSTSQRAMVADEIARLKNGVRKSPVPNGTGDTTRDEAADLMKVSSRLVARARRVKTQCVPELVAAVIAGAITVNAAHDVAGLPEEEQRHVLAAGAAGARVSRARRSQGLPARRVFLHEGVAAKEVRAGVVRVKPITDEPIAKGGGRARSEDNHEAVRKLTEQGFTLTDIIERTGLKKSFVHHARHLIRKPTSILAGITQDAEVFAESLESRASNFDVRWAGAHESEREALIEALRACRTAARKLINRLNKEANGETNEARVCEDQAQ